MVFHMKFTLILLSIFIGFSIENKKIVRYVENCFFAKSSISRICRTKKLLMAYTYDSLTNRCHKVKCCGKPQVLLKSYLSLKECHRNAKRRNIRSVEYFANAPKLVAIGEICRNFEEIVRKDYNITENSKAKSSREVEIKICGKASNSRTNKRCLY